MSGVQPGPRWWIGLGAWLLGALSLGPAACKDPPEQQRPGGTLRPQEPQELEGVRLLGGRTVAQKPGIEPELLSELERSTDRVRALIRFERPLTLAQHRDLHVADIRLLEHVAKETYVVSLPGGTDLRQIPHARVLRWAGRILPEDKLHPAVSAAAADQLATLTVRTIFFVDVELAAAERELERLVLEGRKVGVGAVYEMRVRGTDLARIAASALVICVELAPGPPRPLNAKARDVTRTSLAQGIVIAPSGLGASYTGTTGVGVKIGICDFGVDPGHPDLREPSASKSRVDPTFTSPSNGHGTLVAGIAAGNGQNSSTIGWSPFEMRGHAPEAGLASYAPFASNELKYRSAYGIDEVLVTNHSYAQNFEAEYLSDERGLDSIVRGELPGVPSRPAVWAAGNNGAGPALEAYVAPTAGYLAASGYHSILAPAKNAICVGSVDTTDEQVSEFSSLGPTLDGRIKPDLVAPGTRQHRSKGASKVDNGIHGPLADSGGSYGQDSGTSYAAPAVTGSIALMMQRMRVRGITVEDRYSSTFKAILVQTARDRIRTETPCGFVANPDTGQGTIYHAGPDYASGFGLIDTKAAVDWAGSPEYWREGSLSAAGDQHYYRIEVPSGASSIRFTLAWDDIPGAYLKTWQEPALEHDLDLWLIDPAGAVHRPWILPPIATTTHPTQTSSTIAPSMIPVAGTGIDELNNVEVVEVQQPDSGTWALVVGASKLKLGLAQHYSLVGSLPVLDVPLVVFLGPAIEVIGLGQPIDLGKVCHYFREFCNLREWLRTWTPIPALSYEVEWKGPEILTLPPPIFEGGSVHGWDDPPDLDVVIEGAPKGATLVVFDDYGRLLAPRLESTDLMRLTVAVTSPSQRTYFGWVDPSGKPLDRAVMARLRADRIFQDDSQKEH